MNRRDFFSSIRNSAALAAGGLGWLSWLYSAGALAAGDSKAGKWLTRAYGLREKAAREQLELPVPEQPVNGDEQRYADLISCFSKGLPHNGLGEVNQDAYKQLRQALATGKRADFDAIPVAGRVTLANPQAALSYQLDGADPRHLGMPPPPVFAGEEQGGEMVELYWHALARDVPFSQYGKEPITQAAIDELRGFKQFEGIDADSLFRGHAPGDRTGPYLSQFLWKTIPHGSQQIIQKYNSPLAGENFMQTSGECLRIQQGGEATDRITHAASTRYIRSGRDMGEWVHSDYVFQGFLNAALILIGYGDDALKLDHPYRDSRNQSGSVTLGGPEILAMVAHASNCALKAAWYQKWVLHRRIRPEAYGLRVHHHMVKRRQYPIHENVLGSAALARIFGQTGSYLLPMAYPEGCPTHPSYPAGHAVVVGACLTVLKAYFNEDFIIPDPVVAYDNGFSLKAYRGDDLTVGSELNKLAANIAIGRDFAGLHWRSDSIEGIKLGEQVTLRLLMDYRHTYNEDYRYSLTLVDGTRVKI